MKQFTMTWLLAMVCAGLAQASENDEWARVLEIPCHPLLTKAECNAHRDRMARLGEGDARNAYLVEYFAMIKDRVKSCGCSRAENNSGVPRYR